MSFVQTTGNGSRTPSMAKGYLDLKNSALVSPKSAKGIQGFIFDIPDNERIDLESDITDHFTESNSFINDHVVNKPMIIRLSGFIGELVYKRPDGIPGTVQEIGNRLSTVNAYLGDLTPQGVQIAQQIVQKSQSSISAINQTIGKVKNVVGLFNGQGQEKT